ncbi:nucleotide exchange factor GrpE [Candidatus Falkowbacteria bacterium]|nr:nucleotide exchange factor GrpE [Candidatus Falkowbacteria bacterium]
MSEEIKTGVYRHYKNKDYKVLYTAVDTETKEEVVVYQAIYGEGKIWVRPKRMFLEEVEVDGKKKPRFEFIAENDNDWQKKYLRALADYQNLLKQTAREKMEFTVFANEQMLKEILPVYDHLKLAIEHHNGESTDDWLKGVEHVVKQFKDALVKVGVEEIKVKEEKFDHNLMEAIGSEETEDKSLDGKVAKQVKAGYRLNGKVIEAAKVIVYKVK